MKDFNYKEVGLRIQKLREGKKMFQEHLAEKADLSKNYLSELERGVRKGRIDVYYRIAYALGISLDILVDKVPQDAVAFNNYIDKRIQHFTKDQKEALDECITFISRYDMKKIDD